MPEKETVLSPDTLLRMKRQLEAIQEEHIRAEEQLKMAMANLVELGYNTIEEAETGLQQLDERISKLTKRAETAFDVFIEDYNELFR